MLTAEEQMEMVVLKKHGASIRALTRTTGRSRNTVRRYLRGGADAATRGRCRRTGRPSGGAVTNSKCLSRRWDGAAWPTWSSAMMSGSRR